MDAFIFETFPINCSTLVPPSHIYIYMYVYLCVQNQPRCGSLRISFAIDTLSRLPLPNINNDILPRSATARLILNYDRPLTIFHDLNNIRLKLDDLVSYTGNFGNTVDVYRMPTPFRDSPREIEELVYNDWQLINNRNREFIHTAYGLNSSFNTNSLKFSFCSLASSFSARLTRSIGSDARF